MGEAYKLHCEHCSYNQNIYVGVGFRYIRLAEIWEWFEDEASKERIHEFMQDNSTRHSCFQGLYICEKCNYLLNATFLQMESDTDTYKNSYDCPRCAVKMPSMPIDEELDHGLALACPQCGTEKLSIECFLHWD
ncbi:hypothetical protein ACFYU8_04180 [Brevibacillus sp. NPDC003359]|uniref:hypothetical protein n=1 Tax=unclassified Brevibacillus TaxID=2684853 RepID=UPI0036B567E0